MTDNERRAQQIERRNQRRERRGLARSADAVSAKKAAYAEAHADRALRGRRLDAARTMLAERWRR